MRNSSHAMSQADLATLQLGHTTLYLKQNPGSSNALRPLHAPHSQHLVEVEQGSSDGQKQRAQQREQPSFANLGLVVWQSGILLAELLLSQPPFQTWGPHVQVVDLGSGTGVVGIALAHAGARVTLTDVPHVLSEVLVENVARNCGPPFQARVVAHTWGKDVEDLLNEVGPADIVTGGDLLYDPSQHANLLSTIQGILAPHGLAFLAHRIRNVQDETHFQDLAEQAGLAVSEVGLRAAQAVQLDGYTDGQYQVLRLAWRDLPVPQ